MNNLETERLVLRNWQDGDAEELFLAAKNPNVGPMCGWDPHKDDGVIIGIEFQGRQKAPV